MHIHIYKFWISENYRDDDVLSHCSSGSLWKYYYEASEWVAQWIIYFIFGCRRPLFFFEKIYTRMQANAEEISRTKWKYITIMTITICFHWIRDKFFPQTSTPFHRQLKHTGEKSSILNCRVAMKQQGHWPCKKQNMRLSCTVDIAVWCHKLCSVCEKSDYISACHKSFVCGRPSRSELRLHKLRDKPLYGRPQNRYQTRRKKNSTRQGNQLDPVRAHPTIS